MIVRAEKAAEKSVVVCVIVRMIMRVRSAATRSRAVCFAVVIVVAVLMVITHVTKDKPETG